MAGHPATARSQVRMCQKFLQGCLVWLFSVMYYDYYEVEEKYSLPIEYWQFSQYIPQNWHKRPLFVSVKNKCILLLLSLKYLVGILFGCVCIYQY